MTDHEIQLSVDDRGEVAPVDGTTFTTPDGREWTQDDAELLAHLHHAVGLAKWWNDEENRVRMTEAVFRANFVPAADRPRQNLYPAQQAMLGRREIVMLPSGRPVGEVAPIRR